MVVVLHSPAVSNHATVGRDVTPDKQRNHSAVMRDVATIQSPTVVAVRVRDSGRFDG